MTNPTTRLLSAIAVLAVLGAAAAVTQQQTASTDGAPPALPDDAMTIAVTVLEAQPFVLDEATTHHWRLEQPSFDRGVVLLLDVADRDLLAPRQLAEPVLYVGGETAQRVNQGHNSGKLIVIVPAVDGDVAGLLAGAPVFFGEPALPEQVDASHAAAERNLALSRGLPSASAELVARAGAEPLAFPDMGELMAWSAGWIASHAPDEVDLVRGLTVPRIGR